MGFPMKASISDAEKLTPTFTKQGLVIYEIESHSQGKNELRIQT